MAVNMSAYVYVGLICGWVYVPVCKDGGVCFVCAGVTVRRVGATVLLCVICLESVVSLPVYNCVCVCGLCGGVCLCA